MNKLFKALLLIGVLLSPSLAEAQVAGQSVMGYLATTTPPCPTGNIPCFIQYGATIPTSGGGSGTPFIVNLADPVSTANIANVTCDGVSTECGLWTRIVGPTGAIFDPAANSVVVGPVASGSTQTGAPLPDGCRAATQSPTAVTDGQAILRECGAEGKAIILPYTIKENMLRGANSSTSNTAVTFTGMGAQGANIKIYVTGVYCARTDAGITGMFVTLNDSASTIVVLPDSGGGGGNNMVFEVPLSIAANTAFTFTPSTSITTVYCNAQGYLGP